MEFYYSSNINVQLIVALLKKHGIKKVIASPGTTNLELVASMQHDNFFQMYSCVDERSAAYMACGLAAESQEPVVITCTEATASRDYFPGLTEAYHRKLPILAITGLHDYSCIGDLQPQVINRSDYPGDMLRAKVNLPIIQSESDKKQSEILINKAILELTRHGGGPVHINLPWGGGKFDFSVQKLPDVRVIRRYDYESDTYPAIKEGRIAVYIGTHGEWSIDETKALDNFCEKHNAVAFCDHTSKYYGKYRVQAAILSIQQLRFSVLHDIDLLIHIGEETGDDLTARIMGESKEVWRVSKDGELRDTFHKLTNIFEMSEKRFFDLYSVGKESLDDSYLTECMDSIRRTYEKLPELPFSNIYVASKIAPNLPTHSVIHFGVSDSIRAWTLFNLPDSVRTSCNSGCRGIDGCVSALIGASFANPNKLYFGVVGDLTFFYDMNALGNRCIGNNVRLIIVNNDGGNIFRHTGHPSQTWLGYEKADLYIAAGGHFGRKSPSLVKNYAENLGFEYLSASNKEEFEKTYMQFVSNQIKDKSMIFEIFTESANDSKAFDIMSYVMKDVKGQAKEVIKQAIGDQGIALFKKLKK